MPPSSPEAGGAWLRALWGDAAVLMPLQVGLRPILTGRTGPDRLLHLPAGVDATRGWQRAAAAHAAAHWRFGAPAQPRGALKPVQQALLGVLEDARVEQAALRELPGLRALWLPFHAGADAPAGNGFEALLARLARKLLDPAYDDTHPWVVRARAAFLACDGSSASVRTLASGLGNDIGQMRLPFNPRDYVVHASYRDDGSWLWEQDADLPASDTPLAAPGRDAGAWPVQASETVPAKPPTCYPEWDARIGRYRTAWCSVYTQEGEQGDAASTWQPPGAAELAQVLACLPRAAPVHAGRCAQGEEFHAMGLVDAWLQRWLRQTPDPLVYRRRVQPPARLAVQLLLDASASTAQAGPGGRSWLQQALGLCLAGAARLEALGHDCALAAFASRTRHRVDLRVLKHWDEPATAAQVRARAAALRPAGSTRTGSALRHAAALVLERSERHARAPVVLLLSDGEPHDVDVPDRTYLRADLRRAIAEAGRGGIAVRCVGMAPFLQSRA